MRSPYACPASVRCACCGNDVGVGDHAGDCPNETVDLALVEVLAARFPLDDNGDEVEHTERCFRCHMEVEIGAHDDGCPSEGAHDQISNGATVRLIDGSGDSVQVQGAAPHKMWGTAQMFSATGGAR